MLAPMCLLNGSGCGDLVSDSYHDKADHQRRIIIAPNVVFHTGKTTNSLCVLRRLCCLMGLTLPLALCVLLCTIASAQTCNDANTNTTSGYNSDCPNGRPYCQGDCLVCNPYLEENFYCDCPSGQGCRSDPSSMTFGSCGAVPKYGQSCNAASDCTTNYFDTIIINLPCVNKVCRLCDPAANVTHL